MTSTPDFRKLRRELLQRPQFTSLPRCNSCGNPCPVRLYSLHTTQCERDCASMVVWACDVALARLWSTEPVDAEHTQRIERESDQLRAERYEAWSLIFGLDQHGRGRVTTDASPDDGMPL